MLDEYDPYLSTFLRDVGTGIYFVFHLVELFFGMSYFVGKKTVEGVLYLAAASVTGYHILISVLQVVRDELCAFADSYVRAVLFVFHAANKVVESFYIGAVDLMNFSIHVVDSITRTLTLGSSFLANSVKGVYTDVPSQVISALSMIGDSFMSCGQSLFAVLVDFLAQLVLAPVNVIRLLLTIIVNTFLIPVNFVSQMPASSILGLAVLFFMLCVSRKLLSYNLLRAARLAGIFIVSILTRIVSLFRLTRVKNLIQATVVTLVSRPAAPSVHVTEYSKPTCVICQDKPVTFMSDPCKHVCLCDECVHGLVEHDNRCPMCRCRVTKYDRVFIP